jgi:hypothetical protein
MRKEYIEMSLKQLEDKIDELFGEEWQWDYETYEDTVFIQLVISLPNQTIH